MLVYDITDHDSFDCLNNWLIEIEKNASKNIIKILVGNKCDMENERKVSYEQGKDFAAQFKMQFFETSAKESKNVEEAFLAMTKEVIQGLGNTSSTPKKETVVVSKATDVKPRKKGCC